MLIVVCIVLMAEDVEHFFMNLLATLAYSLLLTGSVGLGSLAEARPIMEVVYHGSYDPHSNNTQLWM